MRRLGSGVVLLLALSLAACAAAQPPCRAGERRAVTEALYFGTARPGGVVSADEWKEFVNQVATPRFPSGLTSWPASGQWRGASGIIEREASYVLQIIHPDAEAQERAIAEIVREYRARFEQEAVLRVRSSGCVSF